MKDYTERLFKKHKFMRRFTLFYVMSVIGYACVNVDKFSDAKFGLVCGLFGTAIALYQWDKNHQRENKNG